jgi:hypothetical protein
MNTVYCASGHYIDAYNKGCRSWQAVVRTRAEEEREDAPHRAKFCATCGAKNLSACEHCETPIRTVIHHRGRPSYCVECARPFPWTVTALNAAKEYADELDELSQEDKAVLKTTFDALCNIYFVLSTPRQSQSEKAAFSGTAEGDHPTFASHST